MKIKPAIALASGREFNFLEPESSDFTVVDIANALSKICRFTGHTSAFYSVAQHSAHASWLVPQEYRLQALLHDAAEAFLGDVSTPLKQLLPDYKAIEARVEAAVFKRFGLPAQLHESVKVADLRMLRTETYWLMPRACMDWPILQGVEPLDWRLYPRSVAESRSMFLDRYEQITGLNPYK